MQNLYFTFIRNIGPTKSSFKPQFKPIKLNFLYTQNSFGFYQATSAFDTRVKNFLRLVVECGNLGITCNFLHSVVRFHFNDYPDNDDYTRFGVLPCARQIDKNKNNNAI